MSESYVKTQNIGFRTTMHKVVKTAGKNGLDPSFYSASDIEYKTFGTNTLVGVKNPLWKSQVRAGVNASTPCTGTEYQFEPQWLTSGYSWALNSTPNVVNTQEYYGLCPVNLPNVTSPSASIVTEVTNRCIRKFLDSCSQARSSVESGQDFGEWKETYHAFLRPMGSMRDLITGHYARLLKAKRLYRNKPPLLRKALADSYLEFTFGWNPLMSDVADAYSGLISRQRMSSVVPVRASASALHTNSDGSNPFAGQLGTITCSKKSYSRYTIRMKGAIRVNLVNGSVPILDVLQLRTLQDFALTAWDLLPYSFLVDYFLNVHDVIQAATFCFSDLSWGNKTVHNVSTDEYGWRVTGLPVDPTQGQTYSNYCYGGNSKATVTTWSRSALSQGSLVPQARFSLPVSVKPWENIAALILGGAKSLVPFY
jgi:hypothetical protein